MYACRNCNQWKGDYWHAVTGRIAGLIVLNPFLHKIEKHLDKSRFSWRGKTRQGRWNVDKFRLASEMRVCQRQDRANIEATITTLNQLLEKARIGMSMAHKKNNSSAVSRLQLEINTTEGQIDTLQRQLSGPMN